MRNEMGKEGVVSEIIFPLGQDPMAVSKAIGQLLGEGWGFSELTVTHITLKRIWEVEIEGTVEIKKSIQ